MFTLIFTIFAIMIFGRLLIFSVKAAWGITKVLFTLVFLPIILIGLVATGLIYVAFIILIILGLISLVAGAV